MNERFKIKKKRWIKSLFILDTMQLIIWMETTKFSQFN